MVWHTQPKTSPTDGLTVWVRPWPWFSASFLAVWDETDQTFTSVTTSLILPWYMISRWAHQ